VIPRLEYQATARGSALKQVICEECGFEYFYVVQRVATGHGTSPLMLFNAGAADQAEAQAAAELNASLGRAVEFVPCPKCGRFQGNMVRKAQRLRNRWMVIVGLTLTITVGIVGGLLAFANYKNAEKGWNFAPSPLFEICVGLTFALGVAMLIAKPIISKRFDPNTQDVEERRQLGQSRSLTRADLERMNEEVDHRGRFQSSDSDSPRFQRGDSDLP
jgi:predicted RNA-binding Zn-ribbon protein involved in translation (DUF1610 family)